MDVSLVIKRRLEKFGLEQRDLAEAAKVTDSYISQLLTGKRPPPAPDRTDIYEKMDKFLKLPKGELAKLADHQRKEQLKKALGDEPAPLFREVRELILRKCEPVTARHIRPVFEKESFGELERLVTQKLLDVVKELAQRELENESWLQTVAELGGRSYEELRVMVLEFLDTDIFRLSSANCISFLDPLINSWNIDLGTFALDIVLTDRAASGNIKRFEFLEVRSAERIVEAAGFKEFLEDTSLSGTATPDEVAFLKRLTFAGKHPTPLYYYRELQNLRDPLHFRVPSDGNLGRKRIDSWRAATRLPIPPLQESGWWGRRLDYTLLQRTPVLRRSKTEPSSKSRPPASHANRPEKRLQQLVLLVDDGQEFRHGLRKQLEHAGYRVLEASAGDEALQIMADERVEILLIDLVMPGLNGMELLREMRRQASPKLQTIALTGAKPLDAKLRPLFRSLGVTRFIAKPVEIGLLLEAIEGGRLTAETVAAHAGAEST